MTTAPEAFVGPSSLTSLIAQANKGKNTTQAQINLMVDALDSQLQAGPLADLNAGAVTGNGFISRVQGLEAGFEQYADQQFGSKYRGTDQIVKLQGERVVAGLIALNQQESAGLISSPALASSAAAEIKSLASGPIVAIGTKTTAITAATKSFEAELAGVTQGLSQSTLTLAQAALTLEAEAEAYRAEIHAGIQRTQLRISGEADTAINALELSAIQIAQANASTAESQLSGSIATFENAVLDTKGLFAPKGALSRSRAGRFQPTRTNGQAPSTFQSLSGTASYDGTGTLTATLTMSDGSPLMGESVAFTLDGGFAGVGVTSFKGVATVFGAPSTAAVGTDVNGLVASFASDTNFLPTAAVGSPTVTRGAVSLTGVSGTAAYGGPATLRATLASASTGQGLAGRSVSFTLEGNAVGTALTDGNGVATLSGATTTDAVGTQAGAVVASFAGDANDAAGQGAGNLVVGQAGTTLSNVSGTASFGGTATLTATLTSATTGLGAAGQTVNFVLDNKIVGSAVTGSNGVATLAGVATVDNVGTDAGGVIATFGGGANYSAAANSAGNLIVSQAATTLTNVAATAQLGGTATLVATLTSTATGQGVAGQTVSFSLDGVPIGDAVTNAIGVASLAGVITSQPIGTDSAAVFVRFAGGGNYSASTGAGNLVVSQAGTILQAVSGNTEFGGTATLTASLFSTANVLPISGQTVLFTLSGQSVGSATTDASGIATLAGVVQNDAVGALPGAVVVSYTGSPDFTGSTASGTLIINKASTFLQGVAGTASFGGLATLTATLTSSVSKAAIPGEVVNFSLDGKSVGSAMTTSSGIATLTGVATTAAVGTDTGGVLATFDGDTNYNEAKPVAGDLVVGQAATTLGSVAGTASFGGTATLVATLTSTASEKGVAGQTVSFTLAGNAVGTAVTDANGIATLAGVALNAPVGVDAGAVAATFAGDASYVAAAKATGDLVVSQADTALVGVAGTAPAGGPATLTATLTSAATSLGVAGETVAFTLDGTAVGTAVTDANGLATLTGVATTDGLGTHTGVVVATFAGDVNYVATTATGDLTVGQASTSLGSVSGTALFGGTASLTATLTSGVGNLGVAGETVDFMLDGTAVGSAVTDANGVATLTGVATTAAVGVDSGAVVASFAGDASHAASSGTGDLTVGQASTLVASVSGKASFGGTATLKATVASKVSNQVLAGETVSFSLDGVAVGTAVTDALGVATLTGVPTSDAVGSYVGNVVASFAGDSSYTSSSSTGNLVVNQAGTGLSGVSGSAVFGGTLTVSATLASTVTGQGIAGEAVSFSVGGVTLGTAITQGGGFAIFAMSVDTLPAGTYPGDVVATFLGDASYLAAADASGDLVVSKAPTTLASVSGTSAFGGPATLMATLTQTGNGQVLAGQTVDFTLDGVAVGSAVTDASGVATLTGVPTSDAVGTDTGGIVVNFSGDSDHLASQGTGDLIVS